MGAYFRWAFIWCDIPVPAVFLFHLSTMAVCKIEIAKQMRTGSLINSIGSDGTIKQE